MNTSGTPILIKDVKVGEEFYLLNKNGLPKYNGNMNFVMSRNNGKIVEYTRLENGKYYTESTIYDQYAVLLFSRHIQTPN